MKRIFTLLVALGLLTAADAQRGNKSNRGRVGVNVTVSGNHGYQQSRFAADRMLRQEIARINYKYDRKIRQVQSKFFMSRFEKARKIRTLEQQRQREISRAYTKARYNGNRYGHGPRRY